MSWNGSDLSSSRPGSPSVPARPTRRPRVLFLALVILLLGGAAALFLHLHLSPTPSSPAPTPTPNSRIATTTPTLAPTNTPRETCVQQRDDAPRPAPDKDALAPGEIAPGVKTNGWIVVKGEEPEVEFDSMYEQQLCWLFTTEPGDDPPPLLPIEEGDRKNLAMILVSQLKIRTKDSDDAANAKDAVNFGKTEAIRYLKEGGDPEQFISEYHKLLSDAHDKWVKATEKIRMAVKDGNEPELVKEYIKRINQELADEGIKAADVPVGFKKRYMNEE